MKNNETSGKVKILRKVPNRFGVDHAIKVSDYISKQNSYFDPETQTFKPF
jgi:hypothetical protein